MARLKYIDVARAFAIFFIVFGHALSHSMNIEPIYKFIYSFHVSAFFIISGYVFKIKSASFKDFLKKKLLRIMVPYLFWAIVFLIPYIFLILNISDVFNLNNENNIFVLLAKILYGNGNNDSLNQNTSLWFLPALFSMQVINYFVIKFANRVDKKECYILVYIVFLIIGFLANKFLHIYLPWGLNTALECGNLFYLGFLLNKFKIIEKIKEKFIFFILFAVVGVIACYTNNTIVAMVEYRYGVYILAMMSGIFISLAMIYISLWLENKKILLKVGMNTMGILIFHKIIILIFQTKMGVFTNALINSNIIIEILLGLLISILSIALSILITNIIRKISPVLIGESKAK